MLSGSLIFFDLSVAQFTPANIIRGLRNPSLVRHHLRQCRALFGRSMSGTIPLPAVVKLYVNNRCNCHCSMCDFGTMDPASMFFRQVSPGETINLSAGLFEKLLHELSTFHPRISIAGVEPLMHPDIVGMVGKMTGKGLLVSLVTNGRLLKEYATELLDAGLHNITVSLDGPGEVHDAIRGEGSYRLAMEGLNTLKLNRKNRWKTSLHVNCTVTGKNQDFLEKHAGALLSSRLADRVCFTLPYFITSRASEEFNEHFRDIGISTPVNTGVVKEDVDPQRVWNQLVRLQIKYGQHKIHLNNRVNGDSEVNDYFHRPGQQIGDQRCRVPWRSMTILAHGEAVIHNRCLHYSVGNLNDTPIRSIWYGERYEYFRERLTRAGIFPICLRCCGII